MQKEKQYLQTMVSKEAYEELSRKSLACQDDLTQALEKVSHTLSSPGLFWAKKHLSSMRDVRVNPLHDWLPPGPSANPCTTWDILPEKACFLLMRLLLRGGRGGKDGGQIQSVFLATSNPGARFSQNLDCLGNLCPTRYQSCLADQFIELEKEETGRKGGCTKTTIVTSHPSLGP